MNKTIVLTLCFLVTNFVLLAQKHTIFGSISDLESGEHLIGATISIKDKNIGVLSNNYGFYSLTIPVGIYNINFSFIGYKTITYRVDLSNDKTINIGLKSEITSLT
jgi:carboxypeptidase-like protein